MGSSAINPKTDPWLAATNIHPRGAGVFSLDFVAERIFGRKT